VICRVRRLGERTIPRGVLHGPRAPKRTVIVMVEPETVQPTGD
jgi:hypothetical protein